MNTFVRTENEQYEMHETLYSDGGITIHADGTFQGAAFLSEPGTLDTDGNAVFPGYEIVSEGFAAGTYPDEPGTYVFAEIDGDDYPFMVRPV